MAQVMAEDGGRVPMSPGLQATLLRARDYAAGQYGAQVLLEHLLLALSEDADATQLLQVCNVDLGRLRNDVAG
jgi:ATP-dependent Clp protease ATP-binding subunit ClpA